MVKFISCIFVKIFNSLIIRILHITLALLIFISTSGLVISKHFCGGKLISTALYAEAVPCTQNKVMKDCSLHDTIPASDEDSISRKNCCDTETTFAKVENEQLEVSLELDIKDYPALFTTLVIDLVPVENDVKTTNYFTYKPPLLVYDLPVSLQTFLI